MLRSCTQKSMAIPTQSALRHKVRNLRAKVRLLLPTSTCCKYQKRSKLIQKIQHNLLMQKSDQADRRWTHEQQRPQKLFVRAAGGVSQPTIHLFHKLDQQQIQQIKEDKLYYLGENHVKQFDAWLLTRQKSNKQNKGRDLQKIDEDRKISVVCFKGDFIEEEKDHSIRNQISSIGDWPQEDPPKYYSPKPMSTLIDHRSSIQTNRRNLASLELTRQAVIKIKRAQKLKNHEVMVTMISARANQQRKMRKELTKQRTERAKKFLQKRQEIGQIIHLSQLLRQICMRTSKSAK